MSFIYHIKSIAKTIVLIMANISEQSRSAEIFNVTRYNFNQHSPIDSYIHA